MKFPYIQECQFRFRAFLICLKIMPGETPPLQRCWRQIALRLPTGVFMNTSWKPGACCGPSA